MAFRKVNGKNEWLNRETGTVIRYMWLNNEFRIERHYPRECMAYAKTFEDAKNIATTWKRFNTKLA